MCYIVQGKKKKKAGKEGRNDFKFTPKLCTSVPCNEQFWLLDEIMLVASSVITSVCIFCRDNLAL